MSDFDENLGPLARLVGTWEGDKGDDVAPAVPDRTATTSKYRERIVFEPTGRVDNHEQILHGLRYRTTAWRVGADEPFHEEVGYWMWDAKRELVMRCFVVPRGITVLAGGSAKKDADGFELEAVLGSKTFGICSNPFLDEEFKTTRYTLSVTVHGDDEWSYEEDTVFEMKGRDEPFHHTDENRLTRAAD